MNLKPYYSTRLKRDYVTFSAIAFFVICILAQLYVTIVVPIQIRKHKMLTAEIERDEMMTQIDRVRKLASSASARNPAQEGEKQLVREVLDQFALYIRENQMNMSPEQVADMRSMLRRYELIVTAWREKKTGSFRINQDTLDISSYTKKIEEDILNSH